MVFQRFFVSIVLISTTFQLQLFARGQFIDDESCTRFINVLNLGEALTCSCVTSSRPFGGVDVSVVCESPDGESNFCFGSQFCGEASFELNYAIPGGVTDSGICVKNTLLDPNGSLTFLPNFCIAAFGRTRFGGGFESCTVDVEGQVCSCSVCEDGFAFNIECVNGPSIQCFGFDIPDFPWKHHKKMKMKPKRHRLLPARFAP